VEGEGYIETDAEEREDSEHEIAAVLLEFVDFGFMVDEGFRERLLGFSVDEFSEV
jgi:hypothetical protein